MKIASNPGRATDACDLVISSRQHTDPNSRWYSIEAVADTVCEEIAILHYSDH